MLASIEITALKPQGRLVAVHVKKCITILLKYSTKKYPAFNSKNESECTSKCSVGCSVITYSVRFNVPH